MRLEILVLLWAAVAAAGCGSDFTGGSGASATADGSSAERIPRADAGDDVSLAVGSRATLNGSQSRDPDGAPVTFRWWLSEVPPGSSAALDAGNVVNPSLTVDVAGTYVVALVVSAGNRESAPDTARITARELGPDGNRPPIAVIDVPAVASVGSAVTLDGSDSSDPDGDGITYQWQVHALQGEAPAVQGSSSALATFTPSRAGTYLLSLTVSDGAEASAASASLEVRLVTAGDDPPIADAGADRTATVGEEVTLDGTRSLDPEGSALTWEWTLTLRPEGSAARLSAERTSSPGLRADVAGSYVASLVVSDGANSSAADEVSIEVRQPSDGEARPLGFHLVDAEYSRALDRVVAVSDAPAALHLVDPAGGAGQIVELSLQPSSVSVGPDGLQAAVGHDGWITWVDLAAPAVLGVFPISCDVLDVVLGGNGWAYGFPRRDQWEGIRSLNLDSGRETNEDGWGIYAGTVAKLHPGGTAMYGANNGLSPSDIERYDISSGAAVVQRDSPYHGDYAMCGNLWMSDDGRRVFTACGNVFRTSDEPAEDMTYNGSLGVDRRVVHADHSSAAGKVASILGGDPWDEQAVVTIQIHSYEFLALERTIAAPDLRWGGTLHAATPTFAFFSASGEELHVLVEAAPEVGLLEDAGITTLHP